VAPGVGPEFKPQSCKKKGGCWQSAQGVGHEFKTTVPPKNLIIIIYRLYSEWIRLLHRPALIDFKSVMCQAPVAPTYNPSYSGGSDQENLKACLGKKQDPISKIPNTHMQKGLIE
jgi:hypothetical protein